MAINIKKKLPRVLQVPFWQDFSDVISTELTNVKTYLADLKAQTFDLGALKAAGDNSQFIEICKMLGFTPDTSLDQTSEYLYQETGVVTDRVKYKTTYLGYNIIFDESGRKGQTFLWYWNGYRLVRAYSGSNFTAIVAQDYSLPFEFVAEQNYASFLFATMYLDQTTPSVTLDNPVPWFLDQATFKVSTKHIGCEYFIDQVILNPLDSNNPYLMTKEYLSYLLNGMLYNRGITDVPHVGCQLSLMCDNTGYFDNAFTAGNTYSLPDLQMKCSILPANFDYVNNIAVLAYMKIGTGTQGLKNKAGSGTYPTDLQIPVYKLSFEQDSTAINSSWILAYGDFFGNKVNLETIGTGDGTTTSFSYSMLHTPILPGSIVITYINATVAYTVTDVDKDGTLSGSNAVGTINYNTGAITLTTQRDVQIIQESMAVTTTTTLSHTMARNPIVPYTYTLFYVIGGVQYIVLDNGDGTIGNGTGSDGITGPGAGSKGTINYSTGLVQVNFSGVGTDAGQPIDASYEYTSTTAPDNTKVITLQYQTLNPLKYTEVGLFDVTDNLVAYATFPPVELGTIEQYVSIQWLVYNGAFPGV